MKEKYDIDYSRIVGKDLASHYSKGFFYDWPELLLFTAILIGSVASRACPFSCSCKLNSDKVPLP
jgi:hypothetical protein